MSRDGSEMDEAPSSGEIVGGKYRVEELLGSGGMGVVRAATHVHLGTRVAIKFLADRPVRTEAIARFLREARVVARMTSRHVVRVLDMGVSHDDAPFVVMELLEGEDLGSMLRRRGPLPIREALEYVAEACDAVAEAHRLGIVHRDIKPSNLFVTRGAAGRVVKVLDFGVAKIGADYPHERADPSFTRSDAVIGSPLYMAPEQAASPRSVDERADVWGLGMTLWQLLTGQPAFRAESFAAVVVKTATAALPDLRALRPDVSHALRAIVAACLEKSPERRLPRAALLGERLSALLAEPCGEAVAEIGVEPRDELRPVAVPSGGGRARRSPRSRVVSWLSASAGAGAVTLVLLRDAPQVVVPPRAGHSTPLVRVARATLPARAASLPVSSGSPALGVDAQRRSGRAARRTQDTSVRKPPDAGAASSAPAAPPSHHMPGLFDRK